MMTTARKIEWGPLLVAGIGVVVLLLGAGGFYLRRHVGLIDALYCGLLLIPAAALLLLTSYLFQHARFVVVMPISLAGLLVLAYPSFAVALGFALIGAVVGPALSEWKEARHQRESTPKDNL